MTGRSRLTDASRNAIDTFLQDMDVEKWICHNCPCNYEFPGIYYTPNSGGYPPEDACPVDRCPDDPDCERYDDYLDIVSELEAFFGALEAEWLER